MTNKKTLIITAALVVVLAAGTVFLLNYEPQPTAPQPTEETENTEIEVLTIDSADEITVKTEELDIKYTGQDGTWSIEGAEDISSPKLATFVSEATHYTTETLIEGRDPAECGLDSPAAEITIKSGTDTHTVLVGSRSALDDVYFASADGVVFTMPASKYEALTRDADYYRTFVRTAINIDDITEVKLERGGETIDIYLPELTYYEGNVWRMRTPFDTLASDDFMDSDVLPQISSVTLSQPAETLGTERARLTVTAGDAVYEFKIGDDDGTYTSVEYGGKTYRESSSLFAFVDAELFRFVNKLVSYVNINDTNACTVTLDGTEYRLEISGQSDDLQFKANGTERDADSSKRFYAELIGVVASGLYDGESVGDVLLSVKFEGAADTTVEYRKINDYTAAAVKNGQTIFTVPLSDIDNLKDKITEYFNG